MDGFTTTDGISNDGNIATNSLSGQGGLLTIDADNAPGGSYIEVTNGQLTLHGGTSSTNIAVNNDGITVTDSTNGQTYMLDNAGNSTQTGDATIGQDLFVGGNSAVTGNSTVGGTLTVTGLTNANGGLATNGANITTSGGSINAGSGDISTTGQVNAGTLAVTGGATIGQDLAVGGNISADGNISTTDGDIVTVNGNVSAGSITMNGSNGRITGVSDGVDRMDVATFGQLTDAVDTLNARIDVLDGRVTNLEYRSKQAFQGVAMGFAMNAAPLNLDPGEGGMSFGAGVFEGEYAGAIRAQFVTEGGFGIGANVGFSEDAVGGGIGASITF